jgi:hypothetical protein
MALAICWDCAVWLAPGWRGSSQFHTGTWATPLWHCSKVETDPTLCLCLFSLACCTNKYNYWLIHDQEDWNTMSHPGSKPLSWMYGMWSAATNLCRYLVEGVVYLLSWSLFVCLCIQLYVAMRTWGHLSSWRRCYGRSRLSHWCFPYIVRDVLVVVTFVMYST